MEEIITDVKKLSERSSEVDVKKQAKIVQTTNIKLKEILKEREDLVALSAPAIGEPYRLFVIKFKDRLKCFINPMIQIADGLEMSREKCSSIPNKEFIRPRNNKIRVIYQTPLGKLESSEFVGKAAMIVQHEVDHLDGLLLSDVGLEVDKDFDEGTDEEKLEIMNMYLESLDIKRKELEKEIQEDEELKQTSDAIDFLTKVQTGEVQVSFEPVKIEQKESDKESNEKTTVKKNRRSSRKT